MLIKIKCYITITITLTGTTNNDSNSNSNGFTSTIKIIILIVIKKTFLFNNMSHNIIIKMRQKNQGRQKALVTSNNTSYFPNLAGYDSLIIIKWGKSGVANPSAVYLNP